MVTGQKEPKSLFFIILPSTFLFSLSFSGTDVGVSGGNPSTERAAVSHRAAQPPLLTTPEPWHLLVTQTPAKEKAKEGETVVLNCHFSSPQRLSLADLMVKWYKEDEKGQMDLLENNVTILPNNSRIFLSGDLSQGDASLVILNVTTGDHGIYYCEVTLPDGKVVTGDGTKLRIRRALGNIWCYLLYSFLPLPPPKLVYMLAEGGKLVRLASSSYGLASRGVIAR